MAAQHFPQRLLQKMGRTVILAGVPSSCGIHCQNCGIAHLDTAFRHPADMSHLAAQQFDGVLYLKFPVSRGNHTDIALLTAHGGIERGLLHDHRADLVFRKLIHQLRLCGKHRDSGIICQIVIANKLRANGGINGLIHRHVRAHVIRHFTRFARLVFLLLHTRRKAFLVHRKALLLQNLSGQVEWETKRIIELKGVRAAKLLSAILLHRLGHLIQDAQPLVDGLIELALLLL